MSEFKGTEGKWTVIDGKASGKQVISESAPKNRMTVASCGGQRREENANLIAEAPQLLEVLQEILRDNMIVYSQRIKANSIILKALGG